MVLMMANEQQFNVYLPTDLVRRVKHAAIDEGVSLKRFTIQALEHELTRLAAEYEEGQ